MDRIIAPLKLGDSSPQVANLQEALLALVEREIIRPLDAPNLPSREELQKLAEGLKRERSQSLFGKATQQLLVHFQVQQGLGDNLRGLVEERTAIKLNELLKSIGAFDDPVRSRLVIHGTVSYPDTSPAVGLTVVAFDKVDTGDNRLGDAITDKEGRYSIASDDPEVPRLPDERRGADVFVRVHGANGDPPFQSRTVRDAADDLQLDVQLPTPAFVVRGQVRFVNGTPAAGATVQAYDKDLRWEEKVGEPVTTDSDGRYEITYTAAAFARAEKRSADLRVAVHGNGDKPVSSDTVFNAPANAVIDLILPGHAHGLSEFALLVEAVLPLLKGQGADGQDLAIDALEEKDFDFLAGDSGIDPQRITRLVQAIRIAQQVGSYAAPPDTAVPAEALYGWFSTGLPLELDTLVLIPDSPLREALEASIWNNIIPAQLHESVDGILAGWARFKAARALKPAPAGAAASLGDVLSTLPETEQLPPDRQLAFAQLHQLHGNSDALWMAAAEVRDLARAIPSLKRTFALAELTQEHPALISALQSKRAPERPESLEYLVDLNPRKWIELVYEHGVPRGGGLDHDGYIKKLQAEVERQFPTQVLAKQLGSRPEGQRFPTGKILSFLTDNPQFDLRTQHIEPFLAEADNRDDSLREGLLELQRIHALTATAHETRVLLDAGFGSAAQIISEGKPTFELKVGGQLSAQRAGQIFAAAEYVAGAVVAIGTTYAAPAASGNAVTVIPAPSAGAEVQAKYPSLRTLFGDLDYCECQHCRSVLGPAAYLADLMHFLQRSPLTPTPAGILSPANLFSNLTAYLEDEVGATVLGALLHRRPDLADLEFSCENTDTKIPYIDLVLEILENAVALPMAVVVEGVDINAEFTAGRVPVKVAEALRQTAIQVGSDLHVTPDLRTGLNAPLRKWIISDGSRRWLVQYRKQQFVFLIRNAANLPVSGWLQAVDVAGAVDQLKQRELSAELEAALAQPLSIEGIARIEEMSIPETQGNSAFTPALRGWTAEYTRAIAVKITMGSSMGAVELLKLDGTQFNPPRQWQWPLGIMQAIAHAFHSGTTSTINPNVAQLLKLPVGESYRQIWNPVKSWWELRVNNSALFAQVLEGLNVSGLTYQNSSIHDRLDASPENRNPQAYRRLSAKETVFPWGLPFDLWLEETRAFLEASGISRAHLIDLARPQRRASDEAAALELLGLSKAEADLISSSAGSTSPWRYWGLTELKNSVLDQTAGAQRTGGWQEILANLSMLLQQSGLTYREYLDFRETTFAGQPKGMLLPPNECRTSNIGLWGLSPAEFTQHLDRVHVFTRLWRKSGWSMRELDLILAAFGGQLTASALPDVALLKRLQAALELPVSVLMGCIHTLETKAWTDHLKEGSPLRPALYDSIFQRPSLRSVPGFKDFALEHLGQPPLTITERADFLGASLGIKPDEVRAWVGVGPLHLGIADAVNLESLSRLHAAATVCRALQIAPAALPGMIALLGPEADPFRAPASPRERALALLELVERIGLVRQSGFDFVSLCYLLRHTELSVGTANAGTQVEQQLTQWLTDFRAALQAGVVLGDGSADNVKRQLARLGWYPALIDNAMGSDGLNYQPRASAVTSAPPIVDPEIPLDLRSQFTYERIDATKAELKCFGSVAEPAFRRMENLQALPAGLVTALETEYKAALAVRVRSLASVIQLIESATIPTVTEALTGLAASPVIPEELQGRLTCRLSSATEGDLMLTGWLSEVELDAFVTANPSLSGAAISLQAKSGFPNPTPEALEDAEGLLRVPDVEVRYRNILARLVSRLELDRITGQLGVVLGSDREVVATLLDAAKVPKLGGRTARAVLTDPDFLSSYAGVKRSTQPHQFEALELLGKIAMVASRLSIKPQQLDLTLNGRFDVMDVLALPVNAGGGASSFAGWRRLADLFQLRDVLPDGPARLARIDAALGASSFATVHQEFADAFELSVGDVEAALSPDLLAFKSASPDQDYRNPSRLLELATLLHLIKGLGTTSLAITRLIRSAPDQSAAQLARTLFAANIKPEQLPTRLRPVSDRLRNRQRNALVEYLIYRDHLADSNELFDRYLIDVEMGSCMLTSRIKQAISSVQLFVQRCLLNLEQPTASEPGVTPDAIDAQRWAWMKFYRMSEAQRKIFLYPENWIEPELRDDKTEIFRAFESDLLQGEITHDTALVAFRKYLDKMADVASLTVVSMFQEKVSQGASVVHFVARDNSEPYKHYYRQWKIRSNTDFGTWTAWEEITAQLDSEHVLVFLFGGSVYLAWPTIAAGQPGHLKWKIGMNLAKRSASGWTKLKKGRGEIQSPMAPNKDERNGLAFRIAARPGATVAIDAYGAPDQYPGMTPNETKQELVSDFFDPDAEKYGGAAISTPYLNLNLRVLDSYPYEYAGKVKQTHYRPAGNVTITIRATYKFTTPKDYDHIGGWNTPILRNPVRTITVPQFSFNSLLSEFIGLKAIKWGTPDPGRKEYHTLETLASAVKLTVEVQKPGFPPITKVLNLAKGNSLTWQEDFIFELKTDPGWLTSGSQYLIKAGAFSLSDDDSLELDLKPSTATLTTPVDTEHYMSGYRELGDHALRLGTAVSLNTTFNDQYFITQAQSEAFPTYEIWSYRDNGVSLLFWKTPTEVTYRVVPFSTRGMTTLKSQVSHDRLLDAVALPATLQLTANPFVVGDGLISAGVGSVTQIQIEFDKVPTSIYNWEVFFHNPLLVATQLSHAQRFEEAQRWFHLIFDPTTSEAIDPSTVNGESARYWRFLPLKEAGRGEPIDQLLQKLARGDHSLTGPINEWAENPFRPHLIARQRLRSYKFAVVQKYVENLIAWGDQLFRRDTIESINEATQLYVLAARILGKRPVSAPRSGASPKSYRDLYRGLDDFSNAWVALEGPVATALSAYLAASFSNGSTAGYSSAQLDEAMPGILRNFGGLYFCVPGNEKLTEYWDAVDDRLFKIRHCMNIEGIERQLPLFEPPIDPALLVKATAAGLDLATVLADLQAPLPLYRFNGMVQKALELCGEVRALGNALLGALEKQDAEHLSLVRSRHEIQMLKLLRSIKERQHQEAETNLEALRKTREVTTQRYVNYQRLMGKRNIVVPAEGMAAALESSTLQLAPPNAGDSDTEGLALISAEAGHIGWLNDANNFSLIAGSHAVLAGVLHALPDAIVGATIPATATTKVGGSHFGSAVSAAGAAWGMLGTNASFQAGRSATIGGHQRRQDEWRFQSNAAAKELEQIDKQIVANEIRKDIAEREITNHDQQMENAQEVDEVMRTKFTSEQLYSWMVGRISGVYFQTYQLAHDIAKQAERGYRYELGVKDSSFIDFGYWDSLKQGLLAGDRLYLDLKRMEVSYLEKNIREYELTKHVSLMQLDPIAVLQLKETGHCEVSLPEALLDVDCPGHYLRRIKSVSLTIPCVVGPYSSVPCTLTLLKHSVRHSSNVSGKYARDLENDDPRFTDSFGAIQSIVTSTGQNDSGMFETNLRDERYLPFEGAGVISSWKLELPEKFRAFDYSTIADVILHLRYTSRDAGVPLQKAAADELASAANAIATPGLVRLFSLRHEFPNEWSRFLKPVNGNGQVLDIDLTADRFPFLFRGATLTIMPKMEVFLKFREDLDPLSTDGETFAQRYKNAQDAELVFASVSFDTLEGTGNRENAPPDTLPPSERYGWIGHQSFDVIENQTVPRNWRLNVVETDSDGVAHPRVRAEAIEDVFVAFHYTVQN